MSVFPNFSNVAKYVRDEFEFRKDNINYLSSLNSWIRVTSAVFPKDDVSNNVRRTSPPVQQDGGLIIYSNPDIGLFSAAGDDPSIYGNDKLAGTIGKSWSGKRVGSDDGQGFRPSPTINSLEIDENSGAISRKATFTITAYTREQMEEVTKYFLEPGFSVFLEWGWNTPKSLDGFDSKLSAEKIAKFQSFKQTSIRRSRTEGHYDNYLGYVTGGNISIDGDKWNITVNLSGYTELPAYLLTNDKATTSGDGDEIVNPLVDNFSDSEISDTETNIGKRRFMRMFNELPENKKLKSIKNLVNNSSIANASNFINFDSDIRTTVNNLSSKGWWIFSSQRTANVEGEEIKLPEGVELVGNEKYIKFGALMDIINNGISISGYRIGDRDVSFYIYSEETPITAFKNIYSTDSSRLFIPNSNTPSFSPSEISQLRSDTSASAIVSNDEIRVRDNTVIGDDGTEIKFPETSNPPNGIVPEISLPDGSIFQERGDKPVGQWGYLENLYVNFDFAMKIISSKNMFIKDALYQILNGMSSAVNGLWDFQLVEKEIVEDGKDTTILAIVDLNFSTTQRDDSNDKLVLNTIGTNSVFLETGLDLELSGDIMNSIIGERLSTSQNSDGSRNPTIFGKGNVDKILEIVNRQDVPETDNSSAEEQDGANQQEENAKLFTERISLMPKANLTSPEDVSAAKEEREVVVGFSNQGVERTGTEDVLNLYTICYLASYKNDMLFSILKQRNDRAEVENKVASPLIPIDFSFTVHGISGIKRGDKFYVKGLPTKYESGFFQVTSVKHVIDGSDWKTEIVGGFRHSEN